MEGHSRRGESRSLPNAGLAVLPSACSAFRRLLEPTRHLRQHRHSDVSVSGQCEFPAFHRRQDSRGNHQGQSGSSKTGPTESRSAQSNCPGCKDLASARSEVQVANLGVDLAKEEVSQARDRFLAGVANNIEVIAAQNTLARANDNQILALYRFNQARADFARSVGQMEKTYSK